MRRLGLRRRQPLTETRLGRRALGLGQRSRRDGSEEPRCRGVGHLLGWTVPAGKTWRCIPD